MLISLVSFWLRVSRIIKGILGSNEVEMVLITNIPESLLLVKKEEHIMQKGGTYNAKDCA